jgi:hypothetical protein
MHVDITNQDSTLKFFFLLKTAHTGLNGSLFRYRKETSYLGSCKTFFVLKIFFLLILKRNYSFYLNFNTIAKT